MFDSEKSTLSKNNILKEIIAKQAKNTVSEHTTIQKYILYELLIIYELYLIMCSDQLLMTFLFLYIFWLFIFLIPQEHIICICGLLYNN